MKQAPRVWNEKFNSFIIKFGLTRSTSDPCLYYRLQEGEITFVLIYVDDGLVCSNKKSVLSEIISFLSKEFKIRTMPADRFLGLDISRNRESKELFISQPHYVAKILEKFRMNNCNPRTVPADPNSRLSASMSPKTESDRAVMKKVPYRQAVGSLMYLMVMTRPDIAFALSQAAQHCENPGMPHWKAVKGIMAYLAGPTDYGLRFSEGSLIGYSDSDYAGDVDKRRSTTGYVFFNHGGLVTWASRRQECTAQSVTEAEFVAACEASKEAVWLTSLSEELRLKPAGPIPLYMDNQSAIRLVMNPVYHSRTKHIDVKLFFIRDQQEEGKIDVKYVGTINQLADFLTKPLAAPRFHFLRQAVGIVQVPDLDA